MSRVQAVKTVEEEKPQLALVETPADGPVEPAEEEVLEDVPADPFIVYVDSLAVSILDRYSLVRVFREEFRNQVNFYCSEKGGNLPIDEAVKRATRTLDDEQGRKLFERLLTHSPETISFHDLNDLWCHSSEDAEFIWRQMKREAENEFITGHLAATVFEPVDWMQTAWNRAKFLGVRDSFIDEYQPEGGVEIAFVDTMAQAYFLQLHWTEEAVRRTNADPRRHSYEYAKWERYKRAEAKAQMWENTGYWEIPYASELECQEQAAKMADHFARLFQRTVRALDNHRLAKAKLKRLSLPMTRKSVIEYHNEEVREWRTQLEQARQSQGQTKA